MNAQLQPVSPVAVSLQPRLSVVIPTRDRRELLSGVLHGLAGQAIPRGSFEVVIVDDGSDPPLQPPVGLGIAIRVVRQAPSGLNVGRNRGVAASTAPLVAFLDDDVLVDPGWAQAMIAAHAGGADGIGGRIDLQYEGRVPVGFNDTVWGGFYARYAFGDAPLTIEDTKPPFGANCAVAREAFDAVGGFTIGLDRNGPSLLSGGDTDFFVRIAEAGYKVVYHPDARVMHRIASDRLTLDYLKCRAASQGATDALLTRQTKWQRTVFACRYLKAGLDVLKASRTACKAETRMNRWMWHAYCRGRIKAPSV